MKTPTLEGFKDWAKANRLLALAVCQAQALAECERERVDAYILPIFHRYAFKADGDVARIHGTAPRPLTTPNELYLSDDPRIPAYYAECDAAHRAHGFQGPTGNCPALMAENLHIEAENALLHKAEALIGVDPSALYGETREKMLKLLLGACLTH